MKRNNIVVISGYRETSRYISDELNALFGRDYIIREEYLNDELNSKLSNCCLIVCSSKFILNIVQQQIKFGIPVVEAKRNIEMDTMPEILNIKSGSTAYVVGANEEGAMEIIGVLKEVGITHLHLVPYYFQHALNPNDIVISITRDNSVNLNVRKIINIGYKTLNMYTAVEIFLKLGLPTEKLRDILYRYKNDISLTNRRTSLINQNLQGILELISDGILGVDDNEEIIFCNKIFAELTQTDSIEIIRKKLSEIHFEESLMSIVKSSKDIMYEVIDYKNKKILVNKQLLPNSVNGFILCIQDITKLQAVETNVRKKLMHKGFVAKYNLHHLIGNSEIIKSKISEAKKIARNDFNVLIQGDNGTGKEMFAQAIHNESRRAMEPFVAVNIAALSDNLIESELFGYEEGAFTGALKGGKPGFFEMAHKGTIFIDEIGDVSPFIQQRLLRVLQEREIMRVGGSRVIPVDVRVISATNKDLFDMVSKGLFRKDLYYRLKVLYIDLPDLKSRPEDIPLIAEYFFKSLSSKKYLTDEALKILKQYSWPGNVRELQNLVCYLESLCDGDKIGADDIPAAYKQKDLRVKTYNKDFESIIAIYDNKTIDDLFSILEMLDMLTSEGRTAGKQRISALLKESGINITPGQMRNRLAKLESHGFVHIGSTKQGNVITAKGQTFLNYLAVRRQ